MKFTNLRWEPHPIAIEAQKIMDDVDNPFLKHATFKSTIETQLTFKKASFMFPNGWGISVLYGDYFRCSPEQDTYEVGITWLGTLTAANPTGEEILGHQTPIEITELLQSMEHWDT